MLSSASQVSKRSQEEGVTIARQFSEVVHALLLVVPMNSILAVSDTVMANVDEEDEDMQPEASTSGTSGQCRCACMWYPSCGYLHMRLCVCV